MEIVVKNNNMKKSIISTSTSSMYNNTNIGKYEHEDDQLIIDDDHQHDQDDDDVPLPGFRFHPTDEELVGFYLRRKVDKRPIAIELIKQIDIYKYDPWDLPKGSNVGDKEWYFYCKRGRKYRNSIRPNRVTGSGFWKATGIDRPVYSSSSSSSTATAAADFNSINANRRCIGLKKSLVYYRGSAGKGTKTDWMMHEFRLPLDDKTTKPINDQEAEVWTLCRILKRNVSYKKCVPDWREVCATTAKRPTANNNNNNNNNNYNPVDASSKSCSVESNNNCQSYISFTDPAIQQYNNEMKPTFSSHHVNNAANYQLPAVSTSQLSSSICEEQTPSTNTTPISYTNNIFSTSMNIEMMLKQRDNWDELGSLVGIAADPFIMYNSYNSN